MVGSTVDDMLAQDGRDKATGDKHPDVVVFRCSEKPGALCWFLCPDPSQVDIFLVFGGAESVD